MARQIVLRSSDSSVGRRQPLLGVSEYPTLRRRRSAAELAGGTDGGLRGGVLLRPLCGGESRRAGGVQGSGRAVPEGD